MQSSDVRPGASLAAVAEMPAAVGRCAVGSGRRRMVEMSVRPELVGRRRQRWWRPGAGMRRLAGRRRRRSPERLQVVAQRIGGSGARQVVGRRRRRSGAAGNCSRQRPRGGDLAAAHGSGSAGGEGAGESQQRVAVAEPSAARGRWLAAGGGGRRVCRGGSAAGDPQLRLDPGARLLVGPAAAAEPRRVGVAPGWWRPDVGARQVAGCRVAGGEAACCGSVRSGTRLRRSAFGWPAPVPERPTTPGRSLAIYRWRRPGKAGGQVVRRRRRRADSGGGSVVAAVRGPSAADAGRPRPVVVRAIVRQRARAEATASAAASPACAMWRSVGRRAGRARAEVLGSGRVGGQRSRGRARRQRSACGMQRRRTASSGR